ncbi:MAG: formate dehydrogenase accessory sulfurtransferase FdhD [Actinomycetota bacterium]|nr:formate dehydrogenase accessory sulfurtransferase FdhD [Actinomycetota bacterium]
MNRRPGADSKAVVWTFEDNELTHRSDRLATEEPLEIRLEQDSSTSPLAVTMRTPGSDFELVAGFLFSEGAVSTKNDLVQMAYCVDREADEQLYNVVTVRLRGDIEELTPLQRHFYTSSACGVCGKANLDALNILAKPIESKVTVDASVVYGLADSLAGGQGVFKRTGGLHAAALFDRFGDLMAVREDVGRHNAVDKVMGWAFLNDRLPLGDHILLVSGRTSFEIMQKAVMAQVPIVCAVSAPSSLALEVAKRFDMTLIGFLRGRRFNLYAGPGRIGTPAPGSGVAGVTGPATNP